MAFTSHHTIRLLSCIAIFTLWLNATNGILNTTAINLASTSIGSSEQCAPKDGQDEQMLGLQVDPTRPYEYPNLMTNNPALGDFPPKGYIGYGLNLLQTSPMLIDVVAGATLRGRKFFKLDNQTTEYKLPGTRSVTWDKPNNVRADETNHNLFDDLETFVNGTTAADRISSDDSLGASYKAVKGTVSLAGTIKHSLDDSHAWGFYAYNFDVLSAYIEDYVSALDEDAILCAVQDLPPWPSDQLPDQDTINKYRDYFQSAGTHIITGTSFGSRLELSMKIDNSNETTVKNFKSDIKVELSGLPSKGSFDVSVKGSEQYSTFLQSFEKTCHIRGGNTTLGDAVRQAVYANVTADDSYAKLAAWESSAQDDPDLTSLTVKEIWTILRDAKSPDLRGKEISMSNAYNYLVLNPLIHYTICSIVVSSAWGEIGLLTPKAEFVDWTGPDPSEGKLTAGPSKIRFATYDGESARSARIQFKIRNDGTAFGIELSYESNGYAGGQASITFIAEPAGMTPRIITNNATIEHDDTNRKEYYGIPADPRGLVNGIPPSAISSTVGQNGNPTGAQLGGNAQASGDSIKPGFLLPGGITAQDISVAKRGGVMRKQG